MRRMPRGQALVELAVFGSLLLMALTFLIRVGLRMSFQQELAQRSFRDGMRDVAERGKWRNANVPSVQYTIMEDRQVPTAGDPFGLSPRSRFTGSSSLVWGKHLFQTNMDGREVPGRMFFMINGEPTLITDDEMPNPLEDDPENDEYHTLEDHDRLTTEMRVQRTVNASGTLTRTDGGAVSTTTSANATETVTTTLTNAESGGDLFAVTNELTREVER